MANKPGAQECSRLGRSRRKTLPGLPSLRSLLAEEVQLTLVEGGGPLLPADVPEPLRVSAEVQPEESQVVAVLGALHGRRHGLLLCRDGALFAQRRVVAPG
jgi:hypothetical protein